MEFLFLLILIAGGLAVWAVQLYNRLRTRSEAVKRAQSNLVGELKKRATLANQLIDIAKGYGDHEKLTHLTVASQTSTAADPAQIAAATSRALAGISFVAERFPELKANETFNTLMGQLQTIENDVQKKREALNAEVERYNGFRASFPAVLVAGQLGFPEAAYFSTDEAGLEAGAAFRTDDGELLRQQFARIGKGVGDATRQIGQAAGSAIKQAQTSIAGPATPGDESADSLEAGRVDHPENGRIG
jgi:LemA protein